MIQNVKGTKDVLPDTIRQWHFVEDRIRSAVEKYGYEELRTPIFEKTEVFSRSIGEETDIVNKEMYTFTDRGGESLTLRPEMTAALVRAVIQNGLEKQNPILRLWYFGSFFRYERPQKGRFREFHQFGAECIGSPNPESDTEVIMLAANLINSLGIKEYKLNLNTLGTDEVRRKYRDELVAYLEKNKADLSGESLARMALNPLRVLDSKDEKDRNVVASAPKILDFLDNNSLNHFNSVKQYLECVGINYYVEPLLVRGLDYYSHTVFEFQSTALGAQDSFGGGGRYDGLFEQLGGKPVPAVGFAMGVERLILIMESLNLFPENVNKTDFFIIAPDEQYYGEALKIAEIVRGRGFSAQTDLMRRSMKSQMKESNRQNAKYTIICGEDEMKSGSIMLKNMSTGEQEIVPIGGLITKEF